MAPKNRGKKVQQANNDNMQHYMKVVPVETCIGCKQQCARGLAYIDKMSTPGAVGYGVPCILTKGSPTVTKGKGK